MVLMNHIIFFGYLFLLVPGIGTLLFTGLSILNNNREYYTVFLVFGLSLFLFLCTFLISQYGENSGVPALLYPGTVYIAVGAGALSLLLFSGPLLVNQMCGKPVVKKKYGMMLFLAFGAMIINFAVLKAASVFTALMCIIIQVGGIMLLMLFSLVAAKKRGRKIVVSWVFNRVFYITLFFFPFLIFDYFTDLIAPVRAVFPFGIFAFPIYYGVLNTSMVISFFKHFRTSSGQDRPVTVSDSFISRYGITKREAEIIVPLVKGLSYIQIADNLYISLKTVKTHVYNIYRKTDVHNRLELLNRLQ